MHKNISSHSGLLGQILSYCVESLIANVEFVEISYKKGPVWVLFGHAI